MASEPENSVSLQPEKRRIQTKASLQPNTAYTPGFTDVWRLYPRKESKVEAFAIWRERGLEERAAEITEKIARLNETLWAHKEMKYIPLPTTWLNQARYEDDLVQHEDVRQPLTKMENNQDKIFSNMDSLVERTRQYEARRRGEVLPGSEESRTLLPRYTDGGV